MPIQRLKMISSHIAWQSIVVARSISICIMLTATFPSSSMAEVLTVRADLWCPYNCVPKSENEGVLIELLRESLKSTGDTVEYDVMPWSLAVAEVRTGKFGAIIAAGPEDTIGMARTEKPQMIQKTCAYGLTSAKLKISQSRDLLKLKALGIVRDYQYGASADKLLKSPEMKNIISPIGGDEPFAVNIRRIIDKKIEAVLEDESVAAYYLEANKIKNIKILGCLEDRLPLWIGFAQSNPKSKSWVAALDASQAALEKSGRLKEILKKYGIAGN